VQPLGEQLPRLPPVTEAPLHQESASRQRKR
jgi:hypothetical protein